MSNPKVSIIIPVYNGSNYLRAAIDSALKQTYENLEIIVVNDGSTDKGATKKVAESYGKKIQYYEKQNGGVSTALNYAIKKMSGEYFSWLSHDDTYEPNKVEEEINYLRENNLLGKKVILYADYYLIDKKGKIISEAIKDHAELEAKPEYALLKGNVNGLTLLIPKKAFEEHGVFDTKLKCTQDYELWRKMARTYKFIHLPKLLVSTRYHARQVSNTSPLVKTEGNELYLGLMKELSRSDRERLEGSEYCFFEVMADFFKQTPYDEARQYCLDGMKTLLDEVKVHDEKYKVSVVIPFYNRSQETIRAVDSALQQTYKNIEIVLVDDGSTDDISAIEQLAKDHQNIKLVRLPKNVGASAARNLGMKRAPGEFIAFLDSDDELLPEKIETQLRYMLVTKSPMSHTSYTRDMSGMHEVIHSGEDHGHCERKLMHNCRIATPTVMLDASRIREMGAMFDPSVQLGEDTCLWLQILKGNYLNGIDEALSIVHVGEEAAAYDPAKQVAGLKNIIRFLLNDTYYAQFDQELSLIMRAYVGYASLNGVAAPQAGGGIVVRNIRKLVFFAKTEGMKSAFARTAKKLKGGAR